MPVTSRALAQPTVGAISCPEPFCGFSDRIFPEVAGLFTIEQLLT